MPVRKILILLFAACFMVSSPANAQLFTSGKFLSAEKAHEKGDYERARGKWEDLLDAKDKDAATHAAFRLSEYYEKGLGVEPDTDLTIRYLRIAAEAGGEISHLAYWRLGFYFENGFDGRLQIDRVAAAKNYQKAIELGDENSVSSLSRVASYPDVHIALNPDEFTADRNDLAPSGLQMGFSKLSDGDSAAALAIFDWHARRGNAQAQFAAFTLLRQGPAEDHLRGLAWLFLSAKGGVPAAQRELGRYFAFEKFEADDAMFWLGRAAVQDDPEAENLLGVLAANPLSDAEPDFVRANAHFERAVSLGNSNALVNLGDLYAEGLGVPQDTQRAISYYREAAREGVIEAKNLLFTRFGLVFDTEVEGPISDIATIAPQEPRVLSPVDLYARVSPSVLSILAVINENDASQGSAVAIRTRELVTNCHVTEGAKAIGSKRAQGVSMFTEGKRRLDADLCTLYSDHDLPPIAQTRSYESLKVGERVFAVGSPSGLTNSLSEGIISGLRTDNGIRLIQTNAVISQGSSGGALFDAEGRLIGITTFGLRGKFGLNFAVSIDEYE